MITKKKNKNPKVVKIPKKDREDLSPKQLRFIELYIRTGNAKQSAIDAGYSVSYADTITTRLSGKVGQTLARIMDDNGATNEFGIQALVKDIEDKGEVMAMKRNRKPEIELLFKLRRELDSTPLVQNIQINNPFVYMTTEELLKKREANE